MYMLNIEYQTTTLRLVKQTKQEAAKILKAKGLTLTQYLNLSLNKLVDVKDLPFIEAKPRKVFSADRMKFINKIHEQNKLPKIKSLSSEEIDEAVWEEFRTK
jgi:addiction module RelB/DinJ family antitoxin